MNSTLAATTRRLASSVLLLALLLGPPLALAIGVGWPLPTAVPSFADIENAVRTGISDTFVVKLLATIAWLAWLQITAAVVLEIASIIRRRPARALPVLPGLQPVIARLVAAALLVGATAARPSPATAAPVPLPPTPVTAAPTPAPTPQPAVPAPAAAPALATVTVERHDSYWAVAERSLGDGLRWREIRDLNVGRTMPDGHVITPGSDLLRPGWNLQVPAAQPDTLMPAATPLVANGIEITVERGEGFWDIAEEQVETTLGRPATDDEVQPYWQALVDANTDRLAEPNDPSLLFTGQVLTLVGPPPAPAMDPPASTVDQTPPPPPTPPTTDTAPPPPTQPATPTTAPTPAAEPTVPTVVEHGDEDEAVSPLVAASAGFSALLAVGAVGHLARHRRRRAHLRLVADTPTSDAVADTHRQLLLAADSPTIEDLHGQLLLLASDLAGHGIQARPRLLQHSSAHLDICLDVVADPPAGWTADPTSPTIWSADLPQQSSHVASDAACPSPLLVTLGNADTGGQLYLDLEAASSTALTGDPDVAKGLARSIATELALSPFVETLDLILIGDTVPPEIIDLDHVRHVDTWNDIADELTDWVTGTSTVAAANNWPNTFVARAIDPDHDALSPVAVIADTAPPSPLLEALRASPAATIALVVTEPLAGALELRCDADRLSIPDLGLDIEPAALPVASLAGLLELLGDTDQQDEQPALFDTPDLAPPQPLDEPEVLVRLLGDVTVDADLKLTAKQTAVLSYITLHGPVSSERVEEAIWPGVPTGAAHKRLANTVSDLRALIGRHHLPVAADSRYQVGPTVATDLTLFDHRVRIAATQPIDEAVDTLRTALELVRGKVFAYRAADRASYTWVDLENLVSTWELRIAGVAEHCAAALIDLHRADDAVDVASNALTVLPTHPSLTEVLMRAHAANGDRLAVQRVYQAHVASLEQLDLDDVAESTSHLYEQLHRGTG
jgi:DNA-binding SARP family transcriptional activator